MVKLENENIRNCVNICELSYLVLRGHFCFVHIPLYLCASLCVHHCVARRVQSLIAFIYSRRLYYSWYCTRLTLLSCDTLDWGVGYKYVSKFPMLTLWPPQINLRSNPICQADLEILSIFTLKYKIEGSFDINNERTTQE